MIEALLSTRLIFVTGKGGVGKSTACAALGLALARRGRRTLIVETDTYSAMADLFSKPLAHGQIVEQEPNLWLQNLLAQDALIHIIQQFVPSERVARTVIQNKVAQIFFKAAPSVNEFSPLNQVYSYVQQERAGRPAYDHVIVDLPASGHAVTFLNVPMTLHGMMRGLGRFAAKTKEVGQLIRDTKRCALVAVCLPEEMPVNETIELADSLKESLSRGLTLTMLNMVHDAPFSQTMRPTFDKLQSQLKAQDTPALGRLFEGNALAQDWYERDHHYVELLRDKLDGHIIELPMLYEQEGAQVISKLADFINAPRDPKAAQKLVS